MPPDQFIPPARLRRIDTEKADQTIRVPADEDTLRRIAVDTGGSYHAAHSEQELRSVYKDIGSQIGYTTKRKNVSWRFLVVGLGFLFATGATSMLWSGRLA